MYNTIFDFIIAFFIVTAALLFSYLPFLYFLPYLKIEKSSIFILLIILIIILFIIKNIKYIHTKAIKLNKHHTYIFLLYMGFVFYALFSYLVIGDLLNDTFTIRTLSIVNPIFAIFAMVCIKNKRHVIITLFIYSGCYFLLLIVGYFAGDIQLAFNYFQIFFYGVEKPAYQNINMYIGLFTLCMIRLVNKNSLIIRNIKFILSIFCIFGMLQIGGRASLVAILVVFLLHFSARFLSSKFNSLFIFKIIIIYTSSLIVLSFYVDNILLFFQNTIAGQRFLILTDSSDSSQRIYLFSKAIELFLRDPKNIIFGAGINGYPIYISSKSAGYYPHNILLELLCEYGILGTILFLSHIIYILRLRKKKLGSYYGNSFDEQTFFLLFIYFSIINLFTSGLRYSWVFIFFTYLMIPQQKVLRRKNNYASVIRYNYTNGVSKIWGFRRSYL